jgi:phage/plasmid-associated DNA primase
MTDAFYRRWIIFHFDKKFQKNKEDPRLIKQLTTPEELSGLLNLALIGLKQLIDEGGFHDKDVEQTRRDYEVNTNDVNAFLYQECIVDITNPEYSTLATFLTQIRQIPLHKISLSVLSLLVIKWSYSPSWA